MFRILSTLILSILLTGLFPGPAQADNLGDDIQISELNERRSVCREHLRETYEDGVESAQIVLSREIFAFQRLAEEALALRAETIKVGQDLYQKSAEQKPLSGRDLDYLSIGIREHLKTRQQLLKTAERHECWPDLTDAQLEEAGLTRQDRLEGVMISLSAALVLYDNYLLAISLYDSDPKLRRLINDGDPAYEIHRAELAKVTLSYNSMVNRHRVRRGMIFYEQEMQALDGVFPAKSGADYLITLIDQSPSYSMVRKWSPLYVIGRKLGFMGALQRDLVEDFQKEGVSLVSMLFGNAVGLVETRKGKLFHRQDVHQDLVGQLHSGDILLEKTPFRLTDKLIPGYWGHAAVWIGTEAELKQLGIWDRPLVRRYHQEIRNGQLVVEALRSGVEMNSLDHFLNVDSVGVVRKLELSPEEQADIVLRALRQVGKSYDFTFDVESNEAIYCSKLVYFTHQGMNWPTQQSMGRTTFTPDDVASRALSGDDLDLVYFIHDGTPISGRPEQEMALLMAPLPKP